MSYLYVFILLIVVIIILALGYLIVVGDVSLTKPQIQSIKSGGTDEFDKITSEIINTLKPYTDSLGSNNIILYLEYYYGKPIKKPTASNALQTLESLVRDIVYEQHIKDATEFIEKSGITYASFLPDNKKPLILDAFKYYTPSSADITKVENIMSISLTSHADVSKETKKFLTFNKLYKFKDAVVNWPIAKIKKELKSHPEKIFEIDLLGLGPRLKVWAAGLKRKDENKESLEKIIKYLDDLRIYGSLSGIETLEDLERKLRFLALRDIDRKMIDREFESRQREQEASRRSQEALRRSQEAQKREQEAKEREQEAQKREQEAQKREKEYEDRRRKEQEKERDDKEVELQEAFYKKLQEDPEMENVAKALGMSLHDLYEQYKLEKGMTVGSAEIDDNVKIDEEIMKKLKEKLELEFSKLP